MPSQVKSVAPVAKARPPSLRNRPSPITVTSGHWALLAPPFCRRLHPPTHARTHAIQLLLSSNWDKCNGNSFRESPALLQLLTISVFLPFEVELFIFALLGELGYWEIIAWKGACWKSGSFCIHSCATLRRLVTMLHVNMKKAFFVVFFFSFLMK